MVAVAVPPVPPSTDVIAPVVFTWSPAAVASTSMESVQLLLARSTVPTMLIFVGESVTTLVSQVPPRLSGLAISSPAGISSLKLTPVRSVAGLGLVSVNVSVTLPFTPTVGELNAFVSVGGDCACASSVHVNAASRTAKIMRDVRLVGVIVPLPLPENCRERCSQQVSEKQSDLVRPA